MTPKCFMCGTSEDLLTAKQHLLSKIPVELEVCLECEPITTPSLAVAKTIAKLSLEQRR